MSWDKKVFDHIKKTKSDKYNRMGIEPLVFIESWNMPFPEGNVIKYLCRNIVLKTEDDILKATHYLRQIWERDYGSKFSEVPGVQPIGPDREGDDSAASAWRRAVKCCCNVGRPESGLGREPFIKAVCGDCGTAFGSYIAGLIVGPDGALCYECGEVPHGGESSSDL